MTTLTHVGEIPSLSHDEAMTLQRVELDRSVRFLRSLNADAWSAATDCPGWDVRTMYQHVLGACEAGASMRENVRQMLAARKHQKQHGGPLEAALSAVQIAARATLTSDEVIGRLAEIAPKTVRGRSRTPGVIRNGVKMMVDGPVVERWSLGYLVDTIYLRDLWMHRIDAARAAGVPLELDAHDARIIADVVAEWSRRHGAPFRLELTGPAGGVYASGDGGEAITIDAVEFCRALAGRADSTGLLATIVPF